jgi:hypothetical protein
MRLFSMDIEPKHFEFLIRAENIFYLSLYLYQEHWSGKNIVLIIIFKKKKIIIVIISVVLGAIRRAPIDEWTQSVIDII